MYSIDVILKGAGLRRRVLCTAILAYQIFRTVHALDVRFEGISAPSQVPFRRADVRAQVALENLPWPATPNGAPDELHGGPKGPLFL